LRGVLVKYINDGAVIQKVFEAILALLVLKHNVKIFVKVHVCGLLNKYYKKLILLWANDVFFVKYSTQAL
jgi:hypothetical protein